MPHTLVLSLLIETHPSVKQNNSDLSNAQVVSLVAKRWRELTPSEKLEWRDRALATHGAKNQTTITIATAAVKYCDGDYNDDDDDNDGISDEEIVPPARKRHH